ncbi:MAG TPA: amidase [Chloroflexota bacterium]|jgi:aspartyl-tRNA(Asn)/glutamyl-tRNA(Gln) amidotransferase subunit A|nr:amidase [Chloroflexota bacterium]
MTEAGQATALHELTAGQAARLIRSGEVSPVELVEHLLRRAEAVDGQVQAWVKLDPERALATARAAEQLARDGIELPPLHGVPFGAKDIFDSAGLTTAASFRPYASRVPTVDAEAVARLKRSGAILLGKMVTTQFAHADPSVTRNPWDAARTPGGSSSGSAAGVAARLVPLALGSQTAGSILRPAAYNGVVGFKPSYGRVSKRGVFPLAWTLDHVGILARSVEDCGLFLAAAAGHDPADPASANQPLPQMEDASERDPAPPRLGLLHEALQHVAPQVRAHLLDVAARFEAAGARIEELTLGEPLDLILAVHHTIMQTEAAATHWQLLEQYPGSHQPRLRAYVEVGRLLPGVAYLHAQRLRRRIRASMRQTLGTVDALLLPTASDVAPTRETTGDPSLQAPFSLVGYPSLSLPSGLSETEQLPMAIQLVSGAWQEPRLLLTARWCEAQLPAMPAPAV